MLTTILAGSVQGCKGQETTPLSGLENSRVAGKNESTARRCFPGDSSKKAARKRQQGPWGALLFSAQKNPRYQYSTTTSPWGTLQQDSI